VDPISHALLGRALNCLDVKQRAGRGAVAAFVLGSLAPDLDIGLVSQGWDIYLHYHQMGTHTIAASPVLAGATAVLVRVFARGSSVLRLFVAALAGVLIGHLSFDLMSGSDMRLLAPVSYRVFAPHLLAMADLSAILILLAGTIVSLRRRVTGGLLVVGGLSVLLAVKTVSLYAAAFPYHRAAGHVTATSAEAVNGSLVRWRFFDRVDDRVRAWTVNAWRREASLEFSREVPDDPVVELTRRLPVVGRFLGFADIPFPRLEQDGRLREVLWSDVKDCTSQGCVMSFGAVLNEQGRPMEEIVQIGGFRSIRPLLPTASSSSNPDVSGDSARLIAKRVTLTEPASRGSSVKPADSSTRFQPSIVRK
jgi:membrane-bound metal-dependent hydrolase YbcI (DUF457 family)